MSDRVDFGGQIARYTARMQRAEALTLVQVFDRLSRLYKPPKTFLHFRTPLDLLVAVILSAQCTDARVNIVTETILYPKYKTAKDYVKVSRLELEKDIHSCGTFHMKAKHIQETCQILIEKYKGEVPKTMEQLIELKGVGRKTANVILSAAFNINIGIAVDTHVLRVAQRLGLTTHSDPNKIELDLVAGGVPPKDWRKVTTLLISHGRAVCTARARQCDVCVLNDVCPSSFTRGLKDLAKKSGTSQKRRV